MLEKYKSSWEYDCSSTPEAWTHNCYMLVNFVEGLKLKINELVDAVNELQKNATISKMEKVEPANPYAEQQKWIGCLVEYGNADDGFRYGILTNIEPRYSAYPFEIDNGRDATADCWLPSKTIFYKGGNNE
jgi:hypothetical protein